MSKKLNMLKRLEQMREQVRKIELSHFQTAEMHHTEAELAKKFHEDRMKEVNHQMTMTLSQGGFSVVEIELLGQHKDDVKNYLTDAIHHCRQTQHKKEISLSHLQMAASEKKKAEKLKNSEKTRIDEKNKKNEQKSEDEFSGRAHYISSTQKR